MVRCLIFCQGLGFTDLNLVVPLSKSLDPKTYTVKVETYEAGGSLFVVEISQRGNWEYLEAGGYSWSKTLGVRELLPKLCSLTSPPITSSVPPRSSG